MEEPSGVVRESVFQIVQELNRSSQVTLEAFQQQLQFIGNLQQQTLEDVNLIQLEIADILKQSITEIKHFQSNLLSAEATKTETKGNDINYTEDKRQCIDTTIKEDFIGKHNFLHKPVERPLMVTSEVFSTFDSIGPSSDSHQNNPVNAGTQNYNLQYTDTGNRRPLESTRINLQDLKKQDLYTQHSNGTEEEGPGSFRIADSTFNENQSGPLSSTKNSVEFEDVVQDDTLCITDLIQPRDYEYLNPKSNLEETLGNKQRSHLDKLFKSTNEEMAGSKTVNTEYSFKIQELKSFLTEADQIEIPDQLESKPLQKAFRQVHINSQVLRSENLQFREQINRLRSDKTFLCIQLSKAEQDAEAYHQQLKAMTDNCEELIKQRKQIQDERHNLCFEKQILIKEMEMLKKENKTFFKDLSETNSEKEGLVNMVDSLKRTTLSYAREKQEIYRKWKEALMENYHLMKKVDERTQHMKVGGKCSTESPFLNSFQQLGSLNDHFHSALICLDATKLSLNSLYYREEKPLGIAEKLVERPEWQTLTRVLTNPNDKSKPVQMELEGLTKKHLECCSRILNSEKYHLTCVYKQHLSHVQKP